MNRLLHSNAAFFALAVIAACGSPPAKDTSARANLAGPFVQAMHDEQMGDARATSRYLDVIKDAIDAPNDPYAVYAEAAALDALVWRSVPALSAVSEDSAIVYRIADGSLSAGGTAGSSIRDRLGQMSKDADDPFTRGLLARALEEIAMHAGDATAAANWQAARGCAREARVTGPVAWGSALGVREPRVDADASFGALRSLGWRDAAVVVKNRGCAIPLAAASARAGVREVTVDADVAEDGTLGIALRTHGPATLHVGAGASGASAAGDVTILDRPADIGASDAARFVRVHARAPGTMRFTVRVASVGDNDTIELDVWDAHGKPVALHAPAAGAAATAESAKDLAATPLAFPTPGSDDERAVLAAGALALADERAAEHLLVLGALKDKAPPALALLYGRALDSAQDLSAVERAERARTAHERVLEGWPGAWESIAAHAVLAGERRGEGEAEIETLKDLDQQKTKVAPPAAPLLDAFDAAVSGQAHLVDRAQGAYKRIEAPLRGTSLLVDVADVAFERSGAERVAFDCDSPAPHARDELDCYNSLRSSGDEARAAKELERIRRLMGAPDALLGQTLRDALTANETQAAAAIFARLLPGERTLADRVAVNGGKMDSPAPGAGTAPLPAFTETETARDVPQSIAPLLTAFYDDPLRAFQGRAEAIAAADRASPVLPSAATAILAHDERYDVNKVGLARFVLFDVRRVSGTTDVEENAQAPFPSLGGRESSRVLRRRIFKKDGRILEPDPTPHASQSHADLSQLEQGDIVEAVYEGFAVPGASGAIGADTPDLLPERTGVHEASIELHLPDGLQPILWSHPLLGAPTVTHAGGETVRVWKLVDHGVRRMEEGTPRMDRNVDVSFTTTTWADVGRAFREELAELKTDDPEVRAWAAQAVVDAKATTDREKVLALTEATGRAVREASAGMLTDIDVDVDTPGSTTARTILSTHEGSRTWLLVSGLRSLGIAAEVVLAEAEPFSADPNFPPHFGRFSHALALVSFNEQKDKSSKAEPVSLWIDADVLGPPLPAGHVSPELRGRMTLREDGTIAPLPQLPHDNEGDEIDIRLVLDEKGDAKGSLTALLHGRASQELAEALVRIVGDQRQRALRNVVLAWLPSASVDDVVLASSEGDWQVALRANVTIGGYAQPEGKGDKTRWILPGLDPVHVAFPRAIAATLGATYAGQAARENALSINRALQYHVHRRVELPKGAQIERAPGSFDVQKGILQASRTVSVEGASIEEHFGLGLSTGTVAANGYGSFVTDAHRTDDAFLAGTRVKPAAPASASAP